MVQDSGTVGDSEHDDTAAAFGESINHRAPHVQSTCHTRHRKTVADDRYDAACSSVRDSSTFFAGKPENR